LAPNGKGEAFLFLEDFVTKGSAPEVLAALSGYTYTARPNIL
jgi:hypothetical protein